MAELRVAAVVLAGGESRRFGGDKLAAAWAGSTVLDTLLSALPPDWSVVCVGPERATVREVAWTREEPPGGGPVPGIAAGLAGVPRDADIVVVVAGDQPNAANAAARLTARLSTAGPEVDAVVAADATGRTNPLLSAFRRSSLARALPPDPAGRAARSLLDGLRVDALTVPEDEQRDVDHPDDL